MSRPNHTQETNRLAECALGAGWKFACTENAGAARVVGGGRSAYCYTALAKRAAAGEHEGAALGPVHHDPSATLFQA